MPSDAAAIRSALQHRDLLAALHGQRLRNVRNQDWLLRLFRRLQDGLLRVLGNLERQSLVVRQHHLLALPSRQRLLIGDDEPDRARR